MAKHFVAPITVKIELAPSSAYASSNKLLLRQLKTEQKRNEITAIPELIKMLDIKGALLAIDVMAYQTNIAKAIVDKGANYLLASCQK